MTEVPQPSATRKALKKMLKPPYMFLAHSFFDPLQMLQKWRGVPYFMRNLSQYSRMNPKATLRFKLRNAWYRSYDRFAPAGSLTFHYFYQDLWAAQRLWEGGVKEHVDVASRLDGFIAHILSFCEVTYIDIREVPLQWRNFRSREGTITQMPFADNSVASLSSLHVIEHVGLGRYGDPVDPFGYVAAAAELTRVLKPGGRLLIGTPVGREALYFDAHRVFDPRTIRDAFGALDLIEFSLINDRNELTLNAHFDDAAKCMEGCGLFIFTKRDSA